MTAKTAIVATLILCLAGCGKSEPTADSFKIFASGFAIAATGERTKDSGHTYQQTAALETFDVRKTDSIVSPFVGDATYDVALVGLPFVHPDVPGYETTANFHNKVAVTFAYQDGVWIPKTKSSTIYNVDFPSLDAVSQSKIGDPFNSEPFISELQPSNPVKIGHWNGWVEMTVDKLKKDLNLK